MEPLAVITFLIIVALVLTLSFYFARKAKSAAGYYAAGGKIHWSVNGIAFAGDYLSAASFLGICGMIATAGYDGFLYSIGYLAGWIVALFVVAEPMKRLGKYTFTDALDSTFNSRGIQLAAALSTLVVSIFYLIPQMVGAGVLVTPLLGLPHAAGVVLVGAIVITIVATAGMTSTTYVQFIKGGMLIIFSFILVIAVLGRGLNTEPDQGGRVPFRPQAVLTVTAGPDGPALSDPSYAVAGRQESHGKSFVKLERNGETSWWREASAEGGGTTLHEAQYEALLADGQKIINGAPASAQNTLRSVGNLTSIRGQSGPQATTGSVGPFDFLARLGDPNTSVNLWKKEKFEHAGEKITVHYPMPVSGNRIMRPGQKFKVEGTTNEKINFVSLMLALFLGTAALPHILIRYYTVSSPAAARKSTIVAIAAIGFFYVLTLYMGLGAMSNGVVNLLDDNMSAPLLAKSFGTLLFAIISAIAFATVLGTVSGLIVAASGAVAHDFLDRFLGMKFTDQAKVRAGKFAAFSVGLIAIVLGIIFKGMNVSFLVGWAFAVAASANLPAIIMLLFWKKTTAPGIVASIAAGTISALGIIMLSPDMFERYGLDKADAPIPFGNPAIISVPISFLALVLVSLWTQKKGRVAQPVPRKS